MDPVIVTGLRLWIAALFCVAAVHKVGHWTVHKEHVASYLMAAGLRRVPPKFLVRGVAACAIGLELIVSSLCLFDVNRFRAAVLAASVLSIYALAMMLRHRAQGSTATCGCSWGGSELRLSNGLIARNIVMAGLAMAIASPVTVRSLTFLDFGVSALIATSGLLGYAIASQLIGTHTTGAWLKEE